MAGRRLRPAAHEERGEHMNDEPQDKKAADEKPADEKPADRKPAAAKPGFALSQAMQDAEHRKKLAGSSGPASGVRRIDPKDYQPAPSSKPKKSR